MVKKLSGEFKEHIEEPGVSRGSGADPQNETVRRKLPKRDRRSKEPKEAEDLTFAISPFHPSKDVRSSDFAPHRHCNGTITKFQGWHGH